VGPVTEVSSFEGNQKSRCFPSHMRTEINLASETLCSLVFRILVVMSVIYHSQEPLESRGTTMHFGGGGANRQLACFFLDLYFDPAVRSSETSVDFNRTKRSDKTLLLMFQPFSTVFADRPRKFGTEEHLKENLYFWYIRTVPVLN
jgi:hypothetical protein